MKTTKRCKNMEKRGSAPFSALVFALAASGLLPVQADVSEGPYVVSDGAQAVDTGYCPKLNSRFEIDFQLMEANDAQCRMFGSATTNAANQFCVDFYINNNGQFSFIAGSANPVLSAQDLDRHTVVVDVKNSSYSMDGGSSTSMNVGSYADSPRPLAIFGRHGKDDDTKFVYCSKMRLYSFRIYEADNLVHDYIPATKGGEAGIYDKIDRVFLRNVNCTGAPLGYGGDITTIPDDGYVSTYGNRGSAGALYFDTGYKPNSKTRVEYDYALAMDYEDTGTAWYPFSANNNGHFGIYMGGTRLGWCAINTATWSAFSPDIKPANGSFYSANIRHTAVIDLKNLSSPAAILTDGFTNAVAATSGAVSYSGYTLKFAANYNASSFTPVKIYGCRIFEDDVPLRSYKPYVKDGIPGLLDVVGEGGFISAAIATNALKIAAGGTIDTDASSGNAYIESDGTQAIDVEYKPKANSCFEADFQLLDAKAQSRIFASARKSGASHVYVEFYINGTSNFTFSAGTAKSPLAYDYKQHSAVLDLANKTYSITGASGGSISADKSADSTRRLVLFGKHTANDTDDTQYVSSYSSKMRLYAFRIREAGVLVHEFVPCKQNGVIGLYDTVDKIFKPNTVSGANAFTMSGKGVGGVERWLVEPANACVSKESNSVTLNACAAGAQSYKWTRNGEAIKGGEDGALAVEWHRGGSTDTYAVAAVYSVFGCDVAGDPISCTVENQPQGTMLVIR